MKGIAAIALLLGAALAASAEAQSNARFTSSATNVAEAAELEARATGLYHSIRDYPRAAKLHERAAALRSAGDAQRVDNLRRAALLYHYSGKLTQARAAMTAAGDAALAAGDVRTAAAAYLDAAFLSKEDGLGEETNRLVRKAQLLTNSPLLSAQEKDAILRRIRVSA